MENGFLKKCEEYLFGNPAAKLKILAVILFGLGIVGSIIIGIISYANWCIFETGFGDFMIPFLISLVSTYISSILIYGFGELIENSGKKAGDEK